MEEAASERRAKIVRPFDRLRALGKRTSFPSQAHAEMRRKHRQRLGARHTLTGSSRLYHRAARCLTSPRLRAELLTDALSWCFRREEEDRSTSPGGLLSELRRPRSRPAPSREPRLFRLGSNDRTSGRFRVAL